MKTRIIHTEVLIYEPNEVTSTDKLVIDKAIEASFNAYAPYSKFKVGAAVLLENGEIITGNNQENAAYPSGLCAERTALFYANANYPNVAVVSLAVAVNKNGIVLKHPAPPCGSCRQVILESENRFAKPIRIILAGTESVEVVANAKALLPLDFDAEFLK
ncbi:MAG TPA: cytidine deaminase [Bacteroidales bacterium]|nr:cytidine deaminase [Bacteroidales bacterium]